MKIKTVNAGEKSKTEIFKMLDELKTGEMLSISFNGYMEPGDEKDERTENE